MIFLENGCWVEPGSKFTFILDVATEVESGTFVEPEVKVFAFTVGFRGEAIAQATNGVTGFNFLAGFGQRSRFEVPIDGHHWLAVNSVLDSDYSPIALGSGGMDNFASGNGMDWTCGWGGVAGAATFVAGDTIRGAG